MLVLRLAGKSQHAMIIKHSKVLSYTDTCLMICTYILIHFTYKIMKYTNACTVCSDWRVSQLMGVTHHVFSTLHALFTI